MTDKLSILMRFLAKIFSSSGMSGSLLQDIDVCTDSDIKDSDLAFILQFEPL
jgi:hypothetical protein